MSPSWLSLTKSSIFIARLEDAGTRRRRPRHLGRLHGRSTFRTFETADPKPQLRLVKLKCGGATGFDPAARVPLIGCRPSCPLRALPSSSLHSVCLTTHFTRLIKTCSPAVWPSLHLLPVACCCHSSFLSLSFFHSLSALCVTSCCGQQRDFLHFLLHNSRLLHNALVVFLDVKANNPIVLSTWYCAFTYL